MEMDWVHVRDVIEQLHLEISAEERRLLRAAETPLGASSDSLRAVVALDTLLLPCLAIADVVVDTRAP